MIDLGEIMLVDVDTQNDFMLPNGALYVPGADALIPTIERLVRFAVENSVPIVASVDAHAPDDPEFEQFPPHCVRGTPGAEKIPQSVIEPHQRISCEPGNYLYQPGVEPVIESPVFSLFANPQAETILRSVGRGHAVVFGVATDYCVKAACLGLIECGYEVTLLTDAVAPVTAAGGEHALRELAEAGVKTCESSVLLG
ncbi:MAG: isochorismatase family cysteine hydrolase [Candidatus Alcyoniella australis]|nr:isochorismatase family cysteine hydrolase [Candidatus Alcyoniella australis]